MKTFARHLIVLAACAAVAAPAMAQLGNPGGNNNNIPDNETGPSGLDLQARAIDSETIELTWTAVENVYGPGGLHTYELGWATVPITAANWLLPAVVHRLADAELPPANLGEEVTCLVHDLNSANENVTIYLAIHVPALPPVGGAKVDDHYEVTAFPAVNLVRDITPPGMPGAFASTQQGPTSIKLTWTAPEDPDSPSEEGRRATAYVIEAGRLADGTGRQIANAFLPEPGAPGHHEEATVNGLGEGYWYFWIRAVDERNLESGRAVTYGEIVPPAVEPDTTPDKTQNPACSGSATGSAGLVLLLAATLFTRRSM